MAVTAKWYAHGMEFAFTQSMVVDWDSGNVYVMLVENTYTPDQDAHEDLVDGPRTNEASGTGYTANGAALASPTCAASLNVITLNGTDLTWASSTITARYAVIYYKAGTDATSALIIYVDFGQDESSSNGDFTLDWNASGIATITVEDA